MKFKKLSILIVLILLTIPICMYISTIIHFTLTGTFTTISAITFKTVINSIFANPKHLQVYLLLQFLFVIFLILITYFQRDNLYASRENYITNTIKTPFIVGQGQHGTARWLKPKEFTKVFKKVILSPFIELEKQHFGTGGLVVGYNKLKDGAEEIYYIDGNTHSITVGATRSGKSRTIVVETIATLGLAGESIIVSDPKSELYHYTAGFMEELAYEVIVIDFKTPLKSNKYNFLQPVINAINNEDYLRAEQYAWDITEAIVGKDTSKMEKIWRDGELAIIAGTIMAVVYENKEHPEYQNLTNVYMFISEMCMSEDGEMPINDYIEDLPPENPASRIFNIARIAPERTRSSFFTSALLTLKLFTSESIYTMTCSSDFDLKDTGNTKRIIYIILPDERLTYYPLASLFVNQQYVSLVESADLRGGVLQNRVNFVLDEMGNFTTIPSFANMLTVGGGRKIRFNLFLQSFSQLEEKYR